MVLFVGESAGISWCGEGVFGCGVDGEFTPSLSAPVVWGEDCSWWCHCMRQRGVEGGDCGVWVYELGVEVSGDGGVFGGVMGWDEGCGLGGGG